MNGEFRVMNSEQAMWATVKEYLTVRFCNKLSLWDTTKSIWSRLLVSLLAEVGQ